MHILPHLSAEPVIIIVCTKKVHIGAEAASPIKAGPGKEASYGGQDKAGHHAMQGQVTTRDARLRVLKWRPHGRPPTFIRNQSP